jgi:hypothetical protein
VLSLRTNLSHFPGSICHVAPAAGKIQLKLAMAGAFSSIRRLSGLTLHLACGILPVPPDRGELAS